VKPEKIALAIEKAAGRIIGQAALHLIWARPDIHIAQV
jgi:hypothetical protein